MHGRRRGHLRDLCRNDAGHVLHDGLSVLEMLSEVTKVTTRVENGGEVGEDKFRARDIQVYESASQTKRA